MKIFTINPGSTSTKVALFEDETCVFKKTVNHDIEKIGICETVIEQLPYRLEVIRNVLAENGVDPNSFDCVVGRAGGIWSTTGGTFLIDDLMVSHAKNRISGVEHPACLGPIMAREFADAAGVPAYAVNPPDTDELQDVARMTGIGGLYRSVHLHALNQKEVAAREAAKMGKHYNECNFIVCHVGGGLSVAAHRHGLMIDGYDCSGGDGPMAPTRCGCVSVYDLLRYMNQGHDEKEIRRLTASTGGFVSWLGTSDAAEVFNRAQNGDKKADMVWNTMIYQIAKAVGSMAVALDGKVDRILLSGGVSYSEDFVEKMTKACSWIAPISVYPGEYEMEAMAAGVMRIVRGEEEIQRYTGHNVFEGFEWDK